QRRQLALDGVDLVERQHDPRRHAPGEPAARHRRDAEIVGGPAAEIDDADRHACLGRAELDRAGIGSGLHAATVETASPPLAAVTSSSRLATRAVLPATAASAAISSSRIRVISSRSVRLLTATAAP